MALPQFIPKIDEIDAEIAMWQRRLENWLRWDSGVAHRGAQACLVEIEKLRRQRLVLTEQTERM